jgi:hypothetical protein
MLAARMNRGSFIGIAPLDSVDEVASEGEEKALDRCCQSEVKSILESNAHGVEGEEMW